MSSKPFTLEREIVCLFICLLFLWLKNYFKGLSLSSLPLLQLTMDPMSLLCTVTTTKAAIKHANTRLRQTVGVGECQKKISSKTISFV